MVEFLIVCIAALLASGFTLFSGFGLGTLLMLVVVLFFPLELAITMTAMVHRVLRWIIGTSRGFS